MNDPEEKFSKKIEEHLTKEAKIKEVHGIIDDVLNDSSAPIYTGGSWLRKILGVGLFLLVLTCCFWYWFNRNNTSSNSNSSDVPPVMAEVRESVRTNASQEAQEVNPMTEKEDRSLVNSKENEPNQNIKSNENRVSRSTQSPPQEEVFATNFSLSSWQNNHLRSSTSYATVDLKQDAKDKFNLKDLEGAQKSLKILINDYPEDWELKYYSGLCHLHSSPAELDEAIGLFDSIVEHDDNEFLEEANWNLVGALILKGDYKEALDRLEENFLMYPNHEYYEKAKKIEKILLK